MSSKEDLKQATSIKKYDVDKYNVTTNQGRINLSKLLKTDEVAFHALSGTNIDDEDVLVWYDDETNELAIETFQDNGWARINYYDSSTGSATGETFDGRWQ